MMPIGRNGDLAFIAKLHRLACAPFADRAGVGVVLTSRVALWG